LTLCQNVGQHRILGSPSQTTTLLQLSKQQAMAHGREGITLTARVADQFGLPLPGLPVRFSIFPESGITLTHVSTTTDAAGQVQAHLRADPAVSLTVSLVLTDGQVLKSTWVEFYTLAIWMPESQITVSPARAAANGLEQIVVSATLKRLDGEPLANRPIRLIASGDGNLFPNGQVRQTDSQGQIQFAIASTQAQHKSLHLQDVASGLSVLAGWVEFQALPPNASQSAVRLNKFSARADNVDKVQVTVVLRDDMGNPVSNWPVAIDAGEHVSGTLRGTTNAFGSTATWLHSGVAHTPTIRVFISDSVSGSTLLASLPVTFVRVIASAQVTATIMPSVAVVGDDVNVRLRLRDGAGAGVANYGVFLVPTSETGSTVVDQAVQILPSTMLQSNEQGDVVFTIRSLRAGSRYLEVFDIEHSTLITRVVVQFVAGHVDLSASDLVIEGGSYWAARGGAVARVNLRDRYGNPVARQVVRLEFEGNDLSFYHPHVVQLGSVYVLTTSTSVEGIASTVVRSDLQQRVLVRAFDAGGRRIGPERSITFISMPDPQRSQVYASLPSEAIANGQSVITVVADVRDAGGAPLAGVPVALSLHNLRPDLYVVEPARVLTTSNEGMALFYVRSRRAGQYSAHVSHVVNGDTGDPRAIFGSTWLTFTSGPIDPVASSLSIVPDAIMPADDATPYIVMVTARDRLGNPVEGAAVNVQVQPDIGLNIVQPVSATDSQGRAFAEIRGESRSPFTVTAAVDGVPINDQKVMRFGGSDLGVQAEARGRAIAGQPLEFAIELVNIGVLTAESASLAVQLSPGLTFSESRFADGLRFTQVGGTLRWITDALAANETRAVVFAAKVDEGVVGNTIAITVSATSGDADENSLNNSRTLTAVVAPPMMHEVQMLGPMHTVIGAGVGNRITYTLTLTNAGVYSDSYMLSVLAPPSPFTLDQFDGRTESIPEGQRYILTSTLQLNAGASASIPVPLVLSGCVAPGTYTVTAIARSAVGGWEVSDVAQLQVLPAPDFISLSPASGTVAADTRILLSWRTHSADAMGSVTLQRMDGALATGGTYPSQITALGDGTFQHTIVVSGLVEGGIYQWTAQLASQCGIGVTPPMRFSAARSVAFRDHHLSLRIARDYNQLLSLPVVNRDRVMRVLSASVELLKGDAGLIFGFVGDGSTDRIVELRPGETRELVLALHGQDAQPGRYQLLAKLRSAREGSTAVTEDTAIIDVEVHRPVVSYTVEDLGSGRYRVVNLGDPLTDLAVHVKTTEGAGGFHVYPSIEHAKLERGASITFEVVPHLDLGNASGLSGTIEVSVFASSSIPGLSRSVIQPVQVQLPPGKRVYLGRAENVTLVNASVGWYCTNNPNIGYVIPFPDSLPRRSSRADLQMAFWPEPGVLPHDVRISLNAFNVKSLHKTVPMGEYSFELHPLSLRPGKNTVSLRTAHMNKGHYIVHNGATIRACYGQYTEPVIASSQEEADSIVLNRAYVVPSAGSGRLQFRRQQQTSQPLIYTSYPEALMDVIVDLEGGDYEGPVYLQDGLTGFTLQMARQGTGEYLARWQAPAQPGSYLLKAFAQDCGVEPAKIWLHVEARPDEEPSDEEPGNSPMRGSYFRVNPYTVPPDGRTPAYVTLTLRSDENRLLPNTEVVLFNEPAFWQTTPGRGEVVSVTGRTDINGQFAVQVTHTLPGMLFIRAYDLTHQRSIDAVGVVNFQAAGRVEVAPRTVPANSQKDKAVITITLERALDDDQQIRIVSSRPDVDQISPARPVAVGPRPTFTSEIRSDVEGRSEVRVFLVYSSPTGVVSDLIGSP
ncbi:MAG: hypothetical protein D6716_01610, partial [Chloroflexi bacterium]